MRKQTKLVAVLSAAALLAIGASMTSFAAKGWVEEGGQWYYYNASGDYVTDDWKKSGNSWFYLGDEGYMLTDQLIEDGNYKYYVNANGAMVTNSWVAVEPDEDDTDDDAPDHYWYYFGANGKAYKAGDSGLSIKTINGKKYGFDQDSRMVYGFVTSEGSKQTDENPFDGALYYFGDSDDGAQHTGWLQYMDGSDLSSSLNGQEYDEMDEMWFYFKPSNGKMYKGSESKQLEKTINGKKYGFDEKGVMIYEWQTTDASSSTASKYFSDQTDGHLVKKSWVYAVPDETQNESDNDDGTNRWFYVNASGTTYTSEIKKINGKKYLFDEDGIMQYDLQWVLENSDDTVTCTSDDTDEAADIYASTLPDAGYDLYYFSSSESDGSMKTGKNIKIELDDDTYTFGFKSSGKAYDYHNDGLVDRKLYIRGILQKAGTDEKYEHIVMDGSYPTTMKSEYLVGTSGAIVSTKKYVKDGDDNWYGVASDGSIYEAGSDEYAKDKARIYAMYNGCTDFVEKLNKDGELIGYTKGSSCS